MPSEPIKNLLILQERDRVRMDLESQLETIPREIEANRKKIEEERNKAKQAREVLLKLESRRKALEGDLEELSGKIVRYKNQQIEVKKNEEYQALTHEIDAVKAAISAKEDEEIQVLLDIDEGAKAVEDAEKASGEAIAGYERRIARLEERRETCRQEVKEALQRAEEARGAVDAAWLEAYDRLLKHVTFPVVVPLRDKKCQGCHLKVSAGSESQARQGKEIATCDTCGRLLYFES